MARIGTRELVILDHNREGNGFSVSNLGPFTTQPGIDGAFFLAYDGSQPLPAALLWSNGKPAVPLLRLGYGTSTINQIDDAAAFLNASSTNARSAEGYSVVYANLFGTTVTDLVALTSRLGPNVVVVRPDVLVALMQRNVAHGTRRRAVRSQSIDERRHRSPLH